jgi:hypothetical protein
MERVSVILKNARRWPSQAILALLWISSVYAISSLLLFPDLRCFEVNGLVATAITRQKCKLSRVVVSAKPRSARKPTETPAGTRLDARFKSFDPVNVTDFSSVGVVLERQSLTHKIKQHSRAGFHGTLYKYQVFDLGFGRRT